MAKRKWSSTITSNMLEFMIEYTLNSNILERICKMTKSPLEYPREYQVRPPQVIAQN
jgi:hypothetical protein